MTMVKRSLMALSACIAVLSTVTLVGAQDQCAVTKDIIFILDTSRSLGIEGFRNVIDFAVKLVRDIPVGENDYRIGAISFSDNAVERFNLDSSFDKVRVINMLKDIPYGAGSTVMVQALTLATQMFDTTRGDRPGSPNIAIMLTDGNSKDGNPVPIANQARARGITLYCIAVNTTEVDPDQIRRIANRPEPRQGGRPDKQFAFIVENLDSLTMVATDVLQAEGVPQGCDPGPPDNNCPGTKADIVFALEGSSAITSIEFNLMLDFLRNVLSQLQIGPNYFQVGVLIYSTGALPYIKLNDFSSNTDVIAAIDNIRQPRGTRHTFTALAMTRDVMFNSLNGDRPDAPNIGILITYGSSDSQAETLRQAGMVRDRGIEMFVIGIGQSLNYNEINAIATTPSHVFNATSFIGLQNAADPIRDLTCFEPNCQQRDLDVVFLVDTSDSVSDDDFQNIKDFLSSTITRFDVSEIYIRVGIVLYGDTSTQALQLNTLYNKADLLASIASISRVGGARNLGQAIERLRLDSFSPLNGARANAPHVAVVLTSGPSAEASYIQEVAEAKASGISFYAVGVGSSVSATELNLLASSPDNVLTVGDYGGLDNLTREVSVKACSVKACIYSVDLAFVLDNSGSMTEDNFGQMIDFVASLVNELYIDGGTVRVAVVRFGPTAAVDFLLNSYSTRLDLVNAIRSLPVTTDGATNIANALNILINEVFIEFNGDRQDVPNAAIFISDARATEGTADTRPAADRTKNAGIEIFSIGVGVELLDSELEYMASDPKDTHLFSIDDFDALGTLESELVSKATCGSQCEGVADVCFIVDSSASIGEANFAQVRGFLNQIIQELAIKGDEKTRVSIITYGDTANVVFYLDNYMDKLSLMRAVEVIPYLGGATNTAGALALLRTQVFLTARGDRLQAPNIAIMFTDGKATVRSSETLQMAVYARHAGIEIFSIGAGTDVDLDEITAIASVPSGTHVWTVSGISSLVDISKNISRAICNDVNECAPVSPCYNGATCVDLLRGTKCICDGEYSGDDCGRQCRSPLDVVFIVDVSGSIGVVNFQGIRDYLRAIVTDLNIGPEKTRVGIVTFGSNALIEFHLDAYSIRDDILTAIDDIVYRGGATDIASAIQLIRLSMFTPDHARANGQTVRKVGVVISDGTPTINPDEAVPQARQARIGNIHMFAIGVGDQISMNLLRGLASDPDDKNVLVADSISTLTLQVRENLVDPICNDVNECSPNPCVNGATCVNNIQGYECMCLPGFAGVNCDKTCSGSLDVVFLVDASGSIGEANFYKQLGFLQGIANLLEFSGQTRVGMVTFSDRALTHFNLDTYTTRAGVLNAISSVPYTKGATNTAEGLRSMRTMFLTSGRRGVPKYAVMLTDGTPTVKKGQENQEAMDAKANGVRIVTIGVGSSISQDKLQELASDPGRDVFMATDFDALDALRETMGDKLCRGL